MNIGMAVWGRQEGPSDSLLSVMGFFLRCQYQELCANRGRQRHLIITQSATCLRGRGVTGGFPMNFIRLGVVGEENTRKDVLTGKSVQ